jgi:hypothetical protein
MKLEEAVRQLAEIVCSNIEQRKTVADILIKGGLKEDNGNTPRNGLCVSIFDTHFRFYETISNAHPKVTATEFINANS